MSETKQEMTWLYGVVPAGAELKELKRRGGRLPGDVRVVRVGDLGVIVGGAPGESAKAIRDRALAHARVLEVAVLDAPVVPFRFGMVVEDDALEGELEPWRDQLALLLEGVRDFVQLTLKASYREDVVLREVVERDPEIASLREQIRGRDEFAMREHRMRLGELIGLALEGLRERDAGEMLERLSPLAAASMVDALESEYMVLNAPFLVARGRVQEFEDAAGVVADEQAGRMRLTLQGPMPAFDFIGAEQMPWA